MTQQKTQNREHIKALLKEGYTIQDIAEVMEHSVVWVEQYITTMEA